MHFRKRLERGRFAALWRDDALAVRLTASELGLFIEGCTLVGKQVLSPDDHGEEVSLDALLERESDIEELRRVAMALHAQLQHTIRQFFYERMRRAAGRFQTARHLGDVECRRG